MLPGVDWKSLSGDGILIKTKNGNLVLTGDRPRGALYAVYTLTATFALLFHMSVSRLHPDFWNALPMNPVPGRDIKTPECVRF